MLFVLALIMSIFLGCNLETTRPEILTPIIWDNEPSGTLTVINNTKYDMVLFKGLPSIPNIIGGVQATSEVIKDISDDVPDFGIGGPMVIRVMKKSEYDTNIDDLSKGKLYYSELTAYRQNITYRMAISSLLDGNFGYIVSNRSSAWGLELRRNSSDGEKIAYISPAESNILIQDSSSDIITIFPVYIAYTQSELVSIFPAGIEDICDIAPRSGIYDTYIFPLRDLPLWDLIGGN